ncbi:MAG: DUF1727 domain-containing protein, partial [Ktedonobacteraceae bacterium]|nr:DUF1727 domain-containing protein [Ktedonobacteraceae bacterium]
RHVLFVLNDNIADGQDISWIWDVDFERVIGQTKTLTVSGTRALDLALRLKYAGVREDEMTIVPQAPLRAQRSERVTRVRRKREGMKDKVVTRPYGLKSALSSALKQTPEGETLFVVPTYTGLLEVHRELESRGLTPRYWEGKDA